MLKTLFVVDDEFSLSRSLGAISFHDYLRDYPKIGESKTRIINLCDIEMYLSQGYYCSLLAEARGHLVMPNVKTINSLRSQETCLWFAWEVFKGNKIMDSETEVLICMGNSIGGRYQNVATRIFQELPAPLLHVTMIPENKGFRVLVSSLSLKHVPDEYMAECLDTLERSVITKWRNPKGAKKFRWDLALLVNNEEKVPPSNKGALNRFVKAGSKLGIRVQLLTSNELTNVNQFDALFIRETTAINHVTYRLASQAEQQGLVVIDDTDSILRCCNKVFLHDAFHYQKVPSLKTEFVYNDEPSTLDFLVDEFGFPVVLKMPESSFSKGVFKVNSRQELKLKLEELLRDSAIVLAQEYLYTEYDWRIGVLNGRALYACRYYMARNHWQIYNHEVTRNFSGGFDALPTYEVPRPILHAALKAAAVVGNSLYGIDIKEVDGNAYVLEVNDNPNIDHNIEDAYLGDELYMQIMAEFLRRLEQRAQ